MSAGRRTAALAAVLMTAVLAAGGCARDSHLETRTFRLQRMNPDDALKIVQPYVYPDRSGAHGAVSATRQALTVRELPENLDRIAAVLKEYDAAPENVLLRFQLIEADGFAGRDTAIAAVESQLRKLFRFGGYRLAASTVVQGMAGSFVRQAVSDAATPYTIAAGVGRLEDEPKGRRVPLNVSLMGPGNQRLIEASVDVRDGQTVVLGTARPDPRKGAVILVVTPTIGS